MALVFVLLGLLGLLFTGYALGSEHYRRLSRSYRGEAAACACAIPSRPRPVLGA